MFVFHLRKCFTGQLTTESVFGIPRFSSAQGGYIYSVSQESPLPCPEPVFSEEKPLDASPP